MQMAKVGVALTNGRTGAPLPSSAAPMEEDAAPSAIASKDTAGQVSGAGTSVKPSGPGEEEQNWVEPQAFKSLVGKGNAEFSSGHQQVSQQHQLFVCLSKSLATPDRPWYMQCMYDMCLDSGRTVLGMCARHHVFRQAGSNTTGSQNTCKFVFKDPSQDDGKLTDSIMGPKLDSNDREQLKTKSEGVKTQRSVIAYCPGLLQASFLHFLDLLTAISVDTKVCGSSKILLSAGGDDQSRTSRPCAMPELAHSTLHHQNDHLPSRA